MLFNSLDFAIFLPIVFVLYWSLRNHRKSQNVVIVVASYVFYGSWDWRFLFLILFSTLVDYSMGLAIDRYRGRKLLPKIFLWTSVFVNIGLLGYFKYFNFFLENFSEVFKFFGNPIHINGLAIVLPVGISFYTFQTLSYTIDVYRDKLKPTRNIIDFSAFVSFFPQLVAGPIERATHLLPQFYTKRKFDYHQAKDGVLLILWGLFKKIVIADNCAQYVNDIFGNYDQYSSGTLIIGAVYFAFQIYGDFSGYSDIAIGTARLFGFDLMRNFAYPYFSRDIAEFWRRWHISLSTWFRDYLYIPLGGSRVGTFKKVRNTFIIFLVSGFWHGANWTFIIWGALNALYFLPLLLSGKNRNHLHIVAENKMLPSLSEAFKIGTTFLITVFAWIFFRADNLSQAVAYIHKIFQFNFQIERLSINRFAFEIIPLIGLLIIFEWFARNKEHPLKNTSYLHLKVVFLIGMILIFGSFSDVQQFIYFQF